ncbi:MAG: hypothetical protein CL466_05430 [Acidimicrobiaceae bacterium]|nr:hypothetical protein [Acidimicrobiaceae bacterium]
MAHRTLPSEDTMPAIYREWKIWLREQEDKEDHTIRAYGQGLRRILLFGDVGDVANFEPGYFNQRGLTDAVRTMCADEGTSRATRNQTLAALTSFYDFCLADGFVNEIPDIARIRKVANTKVRRTNPEYYSPEELRELFQESATEGEPGKGVRWPARDLAMCGFLATMGLRSTEITEARVSWETRLPGFSDRETRIIAIEGKGKYFRQIPLSRELARAHDRWQREREERFGPPAMDDRMFVANDGSAFTYQRLRYWLKVLNRGAGLRDRSLHSLRHTAGVQLALEGVPANVIQSLMGHTTVATTGIYMDLVGGQLQEHLERTMATALLGEALSR